MATLEDQLLSSFQQTVSTKGPTIELESDVVQAKKTPLTYEQMKEILETGGSIPEGSTLPTSLSMKQYASLPGGLSAYQNLQGMGMMEAIKGTAGFGTGPGGIDTDPTEPPEEEPPKVIAHNCPEGYVFDSARQMCVIEPKEEEGPQYDDTQSSYNSFVEMVIASPDFDGTMESFTKNANNSWLGKNWTTFYNDDSMLSNTLNEFVGPDMIYGGGGDVDFEGMPTSFTDQQISDYQTANQQPEPVVIPNELLPDIDPVTYEMEDKDKPDSAGTIIQSGPVYSGQPLTQYQPPQKEETNKPEGKTFDASFNEKVSGYGPAFNEGGFIQQAKPLQLDDVSLKMQEGGQIPVEQPMEGMPVPSGQPAGFIEDPSAAPAPDNTMDAMQGEGQKDDVMGELPEGTFVINAMAVQLAGIDELDKMVEEAYEALVENLKEKGVEVPLIQQLVDRSRSIGKVDVAVSNGEYIIPPELVPIIGEDRLRKINDRGLRKLEETKKTREKQQAPAQMKEGGFAIATDPDGKILTEKVKDESGREVSRILAKNEVVSPEDKGQPSDVSTKDINESKSFVRRKGVDEYIEDDPRQMDKQGFSVTTPKESKPITQQEPSERKSIPPVSQPPITKTEYQDPEELRDAATYAETQPMEKQTKGFVQPQLNVSEASGLGVTKPEYQDPEELRDAATYSNKPAGNISLDNALEHIQSLYDNGDYSGLLNIMIDQDNTFFNFPEGAKARARDLAQQLLANKKSSAAKKLLDSSINDEVKAQGMMVGSGLFDETGKRRTEVESVTKNNEVDAYKYNDIKNTYDEFMELGAKEGFADVKRKQVATTAQGAALTDPNYQIPIGMKLLPHKNLNVPHFIELLYRLGKKENVNQEIYKDSYNGMAGGLFQLSFEFFAPKELIDQKNKENNTNLKEKELGKVPKTRRAESIEEFYSPYYQRTMALALLMDHLKTYDGDPVKAIVAYNAGKTRANKLGPNNNFTDFERYVLANNPKDGKRIVRDAKRLVEAVLPEQFNFPAPVVNMSMPVSKPKRVGGFV